MVVNSCNEPFINRWLYKFYRCTINFMKKINPFQSHGKRDANNIRLLAKQPLNTKIPMCGKGG